MTRKLEEKRAIGRAAASMINDGDTIFIDSGTTVLYIAPYIAGINVHIFTTNLDIPSQATEPTVRVSVIGGDYQAKTRSLVGQATDHALMKIRFSAAFLGASAIDLEEGITAFDQKEALK